MTSSVNYYWRDFFKSPLGKAKSITNDPFQIIFLISVYTPFEEFVLKWLPFAGVLRFIPELILYFTLARVLGQKYLRRQKLNSTPIDILVFLFLVSSFISIVINGSSLFPAIENLRALWRYLSVFYILVNIEVSFKQIEKITKAVHIVGLMQATLASLQYFMPANFQQIFAPKEFRFGDYERISTAQEGEVKVGAVSGSLTGPGVLSAFLLLGFTVALGRFYCHSHSWSLKLSEILTSCVYIFSIFATRKRAPLLLVLILPLIYLYFKGKRRALLRVSWFYIAALFLFVIFSTLWGANIDTSFSDTDSRERSVDVLSYFAQIFSLDYWEKSAQNSRGWVISITISSVFKSGSWFGFGPDLDNMREIIFSLLTSGSDRDKILDIGPLEDVYWMAMLAYYGLIGLGIYLLMIWRLFSVGQWLNCSSPHSLYRSLGSFYCTLIILTISYTFIERILKVRVFSLYFWLFSGLVVNAYNSHLRKS